MIAWLSMTVEIRMSSVRKNRGRKDFKEREEIGKEDRNGTAWNKAGGAISFFPEGKTYILKMDAKNTSVKTVAEELNNHK